MEYNGGVWLPFQHTETLERFQSKVLRMTVDALWYVPNTVIRGDLQTPTVKEAIRHYKRCRHEECPGPRPVPQGDTARLQSPALVLKRQFPGEVKPRCDDVTFLSYPYR
jgi:hypothetical protein